MESRLGPYREQVGVTIDTSAVGPMLESKTMAIRWALREKMSYTTAHLQQIIVDEKLDGQLLNRRTSSLANSVRQTPTTETTEEIDGGVVAGGTGAPYARPLEYGSQAHEIVAVNAKALHFVIDGKDIFRRRVMHPGNRAYAFMRGTLDEQAEEIRTGFQVAAEEAAKA